jgi:hypothetical protein
MQALEPIQQLPRVVPHHKGVQFSHLSKNISNGQLRGHFSVDFEVRAILRAAQAKYLDEIVMRQCHEPPRTLFNDIEKSRIGDLLNEQRPPRAGYNPQTWAMAAHPTL